MVTNNIPVTIQHDPRSLPRIDFGYLSPYLRNDKRMYNINLGFLKKPHRVFASCRFYRLVATCHLQTCYNLLKRLTGSPWMTSLNNQLETSRLKTYITNLSSICAFWLWKWERVRTDSRVAKSGNIVTLRARMFRSLIIRTGIKERNIRARNITI